MTKEDEATRKAIETYLSGKQVSGRGTEEDQKVLSETDTEFLRANRKKGSFTPRQTFRIDESLWKAFQEACTKKGKSASEVLRDFIKRTVES